LNNRNIPVRQEDENLIDEAEDEIALRAHLAKSAEDVKCGRVCDAENAFDELITELNSYDCPALPNNAV